MLLCKNRARMNPWLSDQARSLYLRDRDEKLGPYRLLFQPYRIHCYHFECTEMLKRMLFVSALPLVSPMPSRRAACGVALALFFAPMYREVQPFVRDATNKLAILASYAVLLTYGGALVIATDLDEKLNRFAFGCILIGVNVIILFAVIVFGAKRHAESGLWQRELTDEDCRLLDAVMVGNAAATPSDSEHGDLEMTSMTRSMEHERDLRVSENNVILQQLLIPPHEVKIERKVGAGSFGEVFVGMCLGTRVAIKTMHVINEVSVQGFRAEILLTSTLRHPNIVGFVGAAWSRELTCLLLEWASNGSMGDLLASRTVTLEWNEPLLRLATDVARGMVYMHGRSYYDEVTGVHTSCVLHRDLKPDNALITEWRRAKVSDFGTSRALDAGADMTIVGTPLFAAPEVMRGDAYDQAVDVYSFGMILVNMAVREHGILPFISGRWQAAYNAAEVPNPNSIVFRRVLRTLWDEGWRPFSTADSLPNTPQSVNNLAARCCAHDPSARPTFRDILDELTAPCLENVEPTSSMVGGAQRVDPRGAASPIPSLSGGSLPDPSVLRSVAAAGAREQARNEHIRRHSGQFRSSAVRSWLDVQRPEKGKGPGDGALRPSSSSLSM